MHTTHDNATLTVRLPKDDLEALDDLADAFRLKRSEIARRAMGLGMERLRAEGIRAGGRPWVRPAPPPAFAGPSAGAAERR